MKLHMCICNQLLLCHIACYEAYMSDNGAAYACSVGCGVSVDTVINNEIAQISTMNNLMDVLFVSRVMDMLSNYGEARGDVGEEWGDELDVYLSEVCTKIHYVCHRACEH